MNLSRLSDEQQRKAIEHQLQDSTDFEHLSAFATIRKEHDSIYTKKAFPDADVRRAIEAFKKPDLFKSADGTKDPTMRQRTKDGLGFVCVSRHAGPQSEYLRARCAFLSAALLEELAEKLGPLPRLQRRRTCRRWWLGDLVARRGAAARQHGDAIRTRGTSRT